MVEVTSEMVEAAENALIDAGFDGYHAVSHETIKLALTAALASAPVVWPEPDYVYDPEYWETTYPWDDRCEIIGDGDLRPGKVHRFETLIKGPDRFASEVILTRDDDGNPEETELRWFKSREEAEAASLPPAPEAGK